MTRRTPPRPEIRSGGGLVLFNADEGDGTFPVNVGTMNLDGSGRILLTHNAGWAV